MYNLSDIRVISSILGEHGFTFSKSLGQNFIVNPAVCPKIAESANLDKKTGVIEIGAGVGILTQELALRAGKVICVELDERLLPILGQTLGEFDNVEIIHADIMKVELKALIEQRFQQQERVCVCANLPYYITSPVIMMLLENGLPLDSITVMVQKEAGERLCAPVGSRESGAVSVAVSYFAQAKRLFEVKRGSFMPSPNVDSCVIQLNLRKEPAVKVEDEGFFFQVVRSAFGQRRKTLLNSVSAGLGLDKKKVSEIMEELGLAPNVRAENLSMEELAKLSESLRRFGK